MPEIRLFRRELWTETNKAIAEFGTGAHATFTDAAWHVRNRVRSRGRWMEPRSVSRTLLVKGLEFDHVLIARAEDFASKKAGEAAKDFYVAATRASTSLTILATTPRIAFSPVS